MDIDWNVAAINGTDPDYFFTPESYSRYSVKPSFIEDFNLKCNKSQPSDQVLNNTKNADCELGQDECVGKKDPESVQKQRHKGVPRENLLKTQLHPDKQQKWMQAKLGLKIPFPRPSSLNKLEQKTYLEFCDRLTLQPESILDDSKLLARLKELQLRVYAEQEEYMAYLESVARQRVADYNIVHPVAEKFVEDYLEKRRRRVNNYPRCYILHDTVPIVPGKSQQEFFITHISSLLEMGTVYKMILPHMNDFAGSATKVPMDYSKVSQVYPQCPPPASDGEKEKRDDSRPPVSSDLVLDQLLTKYEADVAMSLAAFRCLVDNHPPNFGRQWEMAVTVKEYDVTVEGKTKKQKVVCFDSPFIPKIITPQEKNFIYHKFALKTLILHPKHQNCINLEEKFSCAKESEDQVRNPESGENMFSDGAEDLSCLEVFGTETQKILKNRPPDGASSDSDIDSDAFNLPTVDGAVDGNSGDDRLPSPIACLDGMMDKKPDEKQESENQGDCGTDRRRRSSRTSAIPNKSENDSLTLNHEPRRSSRIASRGRRPAFEFTNSDSEDNLIIDCSSTKVPVCSSSGSERITFRSRSLIESAVFEDDSDSPSKHMSSEVTADCLVSPEPEVEAESSACDDTTSTSQLSENRGPTEGGSGDFRDSVVDLVACQASQIQTPAADSGTNPAFCGDNKTIQTAEESLSDDLKSETVSSHEIKQRGKRKYAHEASSYSARPDTASEDAVLSTAQAKRPRGRPRKIKQEPQGQEPLPNIAPDITKHEELNSKEDFQEKTPVESCLRKPSQTPVRLTPKGEHKAPSAQHLPLFAQPGSVRKVGSEACSEPLVSSFLDQILSEQSRMFDKIPANPNPSFLVAGGGQGLSSFRVGSSQPSFNAAVIPPDMKPASFHQGQVTLPHSHDEALQGSPEGADNMSEDPAEYIRPSRGNASYHMWGLCDLKLIIRYSQHGIYQPYRHKPPYFAHIAPKIEYQAEHGVERMTVSEMTNGWASLLLKRRSRLVRAHINAFSSDIFLFEILDQSQLVKCLSPSALLMSVHSLLNRLTKLALGSYLIGHMPGSPHIQIKKTTQAERGVYDLHLAYKTTETAVNQPTSCFWIPIDTNIRLQYHNKYFRIPCTFEPKDSALVNTQMPQNAFRKHMKKKKKKMGKKN